MWVVKIGGSLARDPLLPAWLGLLAQLGGGRVTVVCGGGRFADEVRETQRHWQLDDLAAHNMAILAMAQTAYQLHALAPALQLATRLPEIRRVLKSGRAALWLPFELQRDRADGATGWNHTSDSIALELARKLNAERLIVVKSCPIDPAATLVEFGAAGIVDDAFPALANGAPFPIDILHQDNLGRVRALLLGEVNYLDA